MPLDLTAPSRTRLGLLLFACASLFASAAVSAQEEIPQSVQIEVLVFEYIDGGTGSEAAPRKQEPDYGNRYVLSEPAGPGWYRVVPASKQRLAGASGVLGRSSRTRLLMHTGWQQPSRDTRRIVLRSEQIHSSGDNVDSPSVEGWLELQSDRGLRVHLDFDHRRAVDGVLTEFRMNQVRLVNPGEIQYFDHPAFGVLVRVDSLDDGQ